MSDVELTDLADGQILKWNATTEKWENSTGGGGSANIQNITQEEYDALPSSKESDDTLYMVYDDKENPLDPSYSYYVHDDGTNGKIIVRQHTTSGVVDETLWFFQGWHKEASDINIPSDLVAYMPSTISPTRIMQAKSWSDDTSTTHNGWIGFLDQATAGAKIRSWTANLSSLTALTAWAVLDVNGSTAEGGQISDYYDPYVYIQSTDLTVRMTDYTSESGTASAVGSLNANFLAWHAFNTEDSFNAYTNGDYWAGNGAGAYLQFDLAKKANITKVAFASYTASSFDLMYSTDGTTYTKAETLTQDGQGGTPYPEKQDYELTNELKNVVSVRFVCNSACNIGCVHLYGYRSSEATPTRRIYMNGRCYTSDPLPLMVNEDGELCTVYDDEE